MVDRTLFLQRGYVHVPSGRAQLDMVRLEQEYAVLCDQAERIVRETMAGALQRPGLVVVPEAANRHQLCRIEYLAGASPYIRTDVVACLASLIETLIGQPVRLFKDKCNLKHPGGGAFAAHQDISAYRHFATSYQVTAAVMLDPAVEANGALQMASHWDDTAHGGTAHATPRGELVQLPYHEGGRRNGDIPDELTAQMTWEMIEAAPGDIIVFDSYVPHRSQANLSGATRRILFFTFNPACEGDLYDAYYRAKWQAPDNPIFHVSTPTMHSAQCADGE